MSQEKRSPRAVIAAVVPRLLIALGVAITVSAISFVTAWMKYGGDRAFWHRSQYEVDLRFRQIDAGVSEFVSKIGSLPTSLAELRDWQELFFLKFTEDGVCLDPWDHPMIYATDGKTYTVISYGADGKPGGSGIDCDMSNLDTRSRACYPTLAEFFFDLPTRGMKALSIACGALAFLICLVTVRGSDLHREGGLPLAIKLGLTVLATTVMAGEMAVLEIPSGH